MSECIHGLDDRWCGVCKHGPMTKAAAPDTAQCGSCEASVIWCLTEKGKRMPLDAEPSPSGRFRIIGENFDGVVHVHYVKNSELEANTSSLYDSHFVTCPDSTGWKRSK